MTRKISRAKVREASKFLKPSVISPMPDPTPLRWEVRHDAAGPFDGGQRPDYYEGGSIRFYVGEHVLEVEAFIRPGHSPGLMVRLHDGELDIEPIVANVVIVKPRPR